MAGQGGSSTVDVDALIEEEMDDGNRHVSLEPLTSKRAVDDAVADDVAQGLVVAQDEIDHRFTGLTLLGQDGAFRPKAGCIGIEDHRRAVLPFSQSR